MALSDRAAVDRYYAHIEEPDRLRKAGRTEEALAAALAGVELLPALVRETVREYGRFNLSSLPPLDNACVLACIRRDRETLIRVREFIAATPELLEWLDDVDTAIDEVSIVDAIIDHLRSNPGAVQSSLGRILGKDGRRIARLLQYLSIAGTVTREKSGSTYRLYLTATTHT